MSAMIISEKDTTRYVEGHEVIDGRIVIYGDEREAERVARVADGIVEHSYPEAGDEREVFSVVTLSE